jgi:hypothetical protein
MILAYADILGPKSKIDYNNFMTTLKRAVSAIEDDLDKLQIAYIDEEDDIKQMKIVRTFDQFLKEATDADQIDRIAAGVTIHNWVKETP